MHRRKVVGLGAAATVARHKGGVVTETAEAHQEEVLLTGADPHTAATVCCWCTSTLTVNCPPQHYLPTPLCWTLLLCQAYTSAHCIVDHARNTISLSHDTVSTATAPPVTVYICGTPTATTIARDLTHTVTG